MQGAHQQEANRMESLKMQTLSLCKKPNKPVRAYKMVRVLQRRMVHAGNGNFRSLVVKSSTVQRLH